MFSTNKYSLNYFSLVPLANAVSTGAQLVRIDWSAISSFLRHQRAWFKLCQFLPLYFVVVSNWLFIPFNNVQFSLWVTAKIIKGVGSFRLWWWCVWAQSDARDSVTSLCCHWLDISQQQALVSDVYSVSVDLSAAVVSENYKIYWDCFLRYFLRLFLWYLDAWNVFRRSKKEKINGWTLNLTLSEFV